MGSCLHGVNDDDALVVCKERDEFDEVACGVGADEGESSRVFVGVVVELNESVFVRVGAVSVALSDAFWLTGGSTNEIP